MRLYEYEGKEIFSKYGIKIPGGAVASSIDEVRAALERTGLPAVVKAQILVGSRGKAGGVRVVKSVEEALRAAGEMLSSEIRGVRVRRVLVERAVRILRELYLSITIDRASRGYFVLGSSEGGVDIEEIALRRPEAIVRVRIDPLAGLRSYHSRILAEGLGLEGGLKQDLERVLSSLYRIMMDYDADLVEINPLAITEEGLVALDSKITIDDNALFRHQDLAALLEQDPRDMDEDEIVARKHGFSYVKLEGDIGVIGNGAGLTMASMDLVKIYGGRPASFLDIGGGATRERVKAALEILLKRRDIKGIFMNVYGGITRCDEVALGVVEALRSSKDVGKRIVVRLVGTNEEEGRRILVENGISYFTDDNEAAREIVRLASATGQGAI